MISLVDSTRISSALEGTCYTEQTASITRMLTYLDLTDSKKIKMMLPTELLVLIFSCVQVKGSTPTRESLSLARWPRFTLIQMQRCRRITGNFRFTGSHLEKLPPTRSRTPLHPSARRLQVNSILGQGSQACRNTRWK